MLPLLYVTPGAFIDTIVNVQDHGHGCFGYVMIALATHGIVQLLFGRIDPILKVIVVIVVMMVVLIFLVIGMIRAAKQQRRGTAAGLMMRK